MTVLDSNVHRYFLQRARESSNLTIASLREFESKFLGIYGERNAQVGLVYRGIIAFNRLERQHLAEDDPLGLGLLLTHRDAPNQGALIPFYEPGSKAEAMAWNAEPTGRMFNVSAWDTGLTFGVTEACMIVSLEEQELSWTELRIAWSPATIADTGRYGARATSDLFSMTELLYRREDRTIILDRLFIPEISSQLMRAIRMNPDELHRLDARKFQAVAARLYGELGYRSAMTKMSGDGGVDIYAIREGDSGDELLVIQCKRKLNGKPIEVRVVRELVGAMVEVRDSKFVSDITGVVITNSAFSGASIRYAAEVASSFTVDLQDYANLQDLLHGRRTRCNRK